MTKWHTNKYCSAENMTRIVTMSFLALFALSGCDAQEKPKVEPTQEQVAEAFAEQIRVSKLRHGLLDAADRTKIPYLKEFLTLYPDSVVRYLSFADADFPSLSVNTTLHARYQFNLRVPVRYSEDSSTIVGYGEPRCYLLEIASVTPRDDGAGGTELGGTSGGDLQEHFGLEEWKKLVESKGDFAPLGYRLDVDRPVPNFDLVKKHQKSLERQIPKQAEQGGADQPATALKLKPEGDSKSQSESEGRSQ